GFTPVSHHSNTFIKSLVKQDFDFILQEKNKAEEELTRQNKYNKLRADIWKLATDKSYTEYELIQKLLN
ncbi:unnamed protein product, partial [marine sediment metagenome]